MRGLVKVNPDSLVSLVKDCCEYMHNFDKSKYAKKEMQWSWRKFKKIEVTVYSGLPFWHQYMYGLFPHFKKLSEMAERAKINNDEIWLSELSYKNMVLLANGNKHANPVYIMNY